MSQITSGVRAVLSHPTFYDALQSIMGARRGRIDLVHNFVRPFSGIRILDLGCGTAEILPYLPADAEYWGCDMSPEYIDAAKRRYGARGRFQCGQIDQTTLGGLPKFDVVLAIGVLHHLDDEVAQSLFKLARDLLAEGGRMITIDPCFVAKQNPVARFLVRRDRGQNVRNTESYRALAHKVFPKVHTALRHRRWIPYTHWIMECSS